MSENKKRIQPENYNSFYPAILGYNQIDLYEMRLDPYDVILLDWFIHFKDSGEMDKKIFDNELYYWVSYTKVLDDLLFFNWQRRNTVYERFEKLCGNFPEASKDHIYPLKKVTDDEIKGRCKARFAVTSGLAVMMKFPSKTAKTEAPRDSVPIIEDEHYTDDFVQFFTQLKENCSWIPDGLYRKKSENTPLKGTLTVQKMIESLLKGTFVEDFEIKLRKNEDDTWLKDMTKEKILAVCKKFNPTSAISLSNFFVMGYGPSKRHSIFLQYCNPSYGIIPQTVQLENIPPKVQEFVDDISKQFKIVDKISLTKNLLEIYTWEKEAHDDLGWMNKGSPEFWGSFSCIMRTWVDYLKKWGNETLTPNYFKLKNGVWNSIDKYLDKHFNVTWTISDIVVARRKREYETARRNAS